MASDSLPSYSSMRNAPTQLPEQLLCPPYDVRSEISWIDFSSIENPFGTPRSFVDALRDVAIEIESLAIEQDELRDDVDDLQEDLDDIEDALSGYVDDLDDDDMDDGEFDDDDDELDEEEDEDADWGEDVYSRCICPKCRREFLALERERKDGVLFTCPHCGENVPGVADYEMGEDWPVAHPAADI